MLRWGFFHSGLAPWWWAARVGVWFVIVVLVVAFVLWLLRQSGGTRPAPGATDDRALAILRERFARGEITREQFDEMRRALE
ncbi:MAG TPA: SHOCT domain-containing protein [Thermomicrobiaceae bacterium]|nr:SHOCT domain-containing protein [Thermomicrobiaceae bacterium]